MLSDLLDANISFSKQDINVFLKKIKELEYKHHGLTPKEYLIHPIRVARILIANCDTINIDHVKLALSHNIIEVTNNSLENLKSILSAQIYDKIKLLTVDRNLQWDWDYKDKYYKSINNSQSASRIKVIDKLDNMFLLDQNPNKEIKINYIYEIEKYIAPMLAEHFPSIQNYFGNLVSLVKEKI